MQLRASVVSQFQHIKLFQCGGRETTTGLGRHGLALQEVLEQDEGLRRAVLGHRVPGAADGDEGETFILHAPSTNLYTITGCTAMEEINSIVSNYGFRDTTMKLGSFSCSEH